MFVVARPPVIVLSALYCMICSFVIFGFEKLENQVGKVYFKMELMNCLYRMLDSLSCPNMVLVSVLRAFSLCLCYWGGM